MLINTRMPAAPLMVRDANRPRAKLRRATRDELLVALGSMDYAAAINADLGSPAKSAGFLRDRLSRLPYEVFGLVYLNTRHRVIAVEELFRGTIDGASVHPRDVVKAALINEAAAVIVFHNHPSGVAEASQADELITIRLREALALIDVRILDHIIVAGDTHVSLAERGII